MSDLVSTWRMTRRALAAEAARVVTLLRDVTEPPSRPADQVWGFAELAAHLSHGWMILPALARGDEDPLRELVGSTSFRHPSELGDLTQRAVEADPERDPVVLAKRIETAASSYLSSCRDSDVDQVQPWLATGVRMPIPVFSAHLLNETVLHGLDLARAAGRRWRVDPAHASLALHEFLVPIIRELPDDVVDADAGQARVVLEFRLRRAGRLRLRLEDGGLHVDDPAGPGRVDARIGTDSATLLMFLWNRQGPGRVLMRGRAVVWGRAPWRAVRMKQAVALP